MSCIAAVKARRGFERQCGKQGLNANVVFSPCLPLFYLLQTDESFYGKPNGRNQQRWQHI